MDTILSCDWTKTVWYIDVGDASVLNQTTLSAKYITFLHKINAFMWVKLTLDLLHIMHLLWLLRWWETSILVAMHVQTGYICRFVACLFALLTTYATGNRKPHVPSPYNGFNCKSKVRCVSKLSAILHACINIHVCTTLYHNNYALVKSNCGTCR